ncbi:MAG: hypothetical protein AVDCRST_MAG87-3972 [uncultured Thermomicrobiales bacterium]|uniref:Uncharacterized protein n=1 Tax=uncultured Thermomicrobiales bacterium TaxID=1645740 RepID=A0A6J4VT64_9BACT|nr:MAG: hypothetical protein AVDCRST_MAG87-3972 [uncultured Thermomicrobiales bacterium]
MDRTRHSDADQYWVGVVEMIPEHEHSATFRDVVGSLDPHAQRDPAQHDQDHAGNDERDTAQGALAKIDKLAGAAARWRR